MIAIKKDGFATACVLGVVIFGSLRLMLPAHGLDKADLFKDLSHLFVGSLFGMWLYARKLQTADKRLFFWSAAGLTILEVLAFVTR